MEKFRVRSMKASEGFYISLGIIIQSLAFGYFLTKLTIEIFHPTHYNIILILKYLATFQLIVITWYEYAIGTIYFQWIIRYLDSFIPFLLGLAQFALITTLQGHPTYHWIFAYTFFCSIVFLAFLNQFNRCKKYKEENKEILERLGNHFSNTLRFAATNVAVGIAFGLLSKKYDYLTLNTILLATINFSTAFHIFRSNSVYNGIVESIS